jgi:hypothetical protein
MLFCDQPQLNPKTFKSSASPFPDTAPRVYAPLRVLRPCLASVPASQACKACGGAIYTVSNNPLHSHDAIFKGTSNGR